MKHETLHLKGRYNLTDGLHVYQTVSACELLDDDKPGKLRSWHAFSGQSTDEWAFDMEERSWLIDTWAVKIDKLRLASGNWIIENILSPICMKHLRSYLHLEKNNVIRKVKPRIRLFKKKLTDSGETQITCLATGFYPRHINLTLLRDGKPVEDLQITGGDLLPNGDGTYQMRKSLEISAKELREEHKYTCTATHLNLDNRLDFKFESELEENEESSTWSVISSVVAVVLVCVVAFFLATLIKRRKRQALGLNSRTSSQSDYTSASSE